jgi:hypothetical protein
MNSRYPLVAQRASHRCEYCRAPEAIFNFAFEVEHIIPVSRGGSSDEWNLALACRACNIFKSDHLTALDEVTKTPVPLFNPREEIWQEHFLVNNETGEIQGITATGRVTVLLLRMNATTQLTARLQWMRINLFP